MSLTQRGGGGGGGEGFEAPSRWFFFCVCVNWSNGISPINRTHSYPLTKQ